MDTPDRLAELTEQETDRLLIRQRAKENVAQLLAPTKPLSVKSVPEMLAADPGNDDWLVEKILPVGAYVLCIAQHKTGKTTAMLNLAANLLAGDEFLGFKPKAGYERKVLYLNADMPERMLLTYMRNLSITSDQFLTSTVTAREFDVNSDVQMSELQELCFMEGVGVLIIDVWGAVFSGDENDNTEVRVAANKLSALRTNAGLDALIILHHSGWGDTGRSRGASSFEGAVDVIWKLQSANPVNTFAASGRIQPTGRVGIDFDPRTWRINRHSPGRTK